MRYSLKQRKVFLLFFDFSLDKQKNKPLNSYRYFAFMLNKTINKIRPPIILSTLYFATVSNKLVLN